MIHLLLVNALVYLNIYSILDDLGHPKSLVRLYIHTYLLYLLEKTTIEVTQDGRNRATNKLVASVKYLWVLATPFAVD